MYAAAPKAPKPFLLFFPPAPLSQADTIHIVGLNGTADCGVLRAGNSTSSPFPGEAIIQLNGNRASPMLTYDDRDPGSKAILVLGDLLLYGQPRFPPVSHVHLLQPAPAGTTKILIDQDVDWDIGDEIVLASSNFDFLEAEKRTIVSAAWREITLDRPLEHHHHGARGPETVGAFTSETRAEVAVLSRNVKIVGNDEYNEQFGAHVYVTSVEENGMLQVGVRIFHAPKISSHAPSDSPSQAPSMIPSRAWQRNET